MAEIGGQFLGLGFYYWLVILGIVLVLFIAVYFSARKKGRGTRVDKRAGDEGQ